MKRTTLLAYIGSIVICATAAALVPLGGGDFDDDGIINTTDLLILFANWGPCP